MTEPLSRWSAVQMIGKGVEAAPPRLKKLEDAIARERGNDGRAAPAIHSQVS